MIKKVQALLAQADHPNTDPIEAGIFRDKAEALMFKHRIDAAMAATLPGAPSFFPQWEELYVCSMDSEFRQFYMFLFGQVCKHVGVKSHSEWSDGNIVAQVVGYDGDHAMVETLYTSCMMTFGAKVEPKYDPSLSEQVNAYIMRSAGMEGRRIAQAIYGEDTKSLRPKVRAMFKAEAELRGEDPTPLLGRGSNMKAYRVNYAQAFVYRIDGRLREMRESRGAIENGLVLASREENIKEAFYTRFEFMRPVKAKQLDGPDTTHANCKKCAKAKSGYCREHGYMRPRRSSGGIRYNGAAQARGRAAADAADIGRSPGGRQVQSPRKELG